MQRERILFFAGGTVLALWAIHMAAADVPPAKIGRFPQEISTSYSEKEGLPSNNVHAVLLGKNDAVYAVTDKGLAQFINGHWSGTSLPPTYGTLMQRGYLSQIDKMDDAITSADDIASILFPTPKTGKESCNDLIVRNNEYFIAADNGLFLETPDNDTLTILSKTDVRQLALQSNGKLVAATENGLYRETDDGTFERWEIEDGKGRSWATSDVRGVVCDAAGRLWCAMTAGVACLESGEWRFYTGEDGLPYNDFTCMAAGADGSVWFGTKKGAIRFDGQKWAYRQGKRWLPGDKVRGIAVDAEGNAWFATEDGVGRIERRPMTLSEKAAYYEDEIEKYIKRTPYGYLSEVGLARPGDKTKILYNDSDNDGLWTSMYGAGECFAYGATKDGKAKERARQAFEALRFLQKVTQGGAYSPPKGYVARTIRSVDDPDPNDGRIERDRKHRAENDALWKVYEPRWPKSVDGQWYWKSDTSSDELDGHYFFYPAYYDLVADTEEEKERVREVVRDLTDHLLLNEYNLVDFDGTPTRWGIYGPNALNNDPNWWAERGLKSLSMLSYLAVAEHVTGDPKYGEALDDLSEKHGYRMNAMIYKIHLGPGSGNQSDDEMAFMSYYNLLKYAKNHLLRNQILTSFYVAWMVEEPEMNPFFNFAYAAFGVGAKVPTSYGEQTLFPMEGWLDDSIETLKGFPLDRVNWGLANSHRIDIIPLLRQETYDPFNPHQGNRGFRRNGKVLPVEERYFAHWNTDPWVLDYKGNGKELASGTVFLLPYYMGLYHGFIAEMGYSPANSAK